MSEIKSSACIAVEFFNFFFLWCSVCFEICQSIRNVSLYPVSCILVSCILYPSILYLVSCILVSCILAVSLYPVSCCSFAKFSKMSLHFDNKLQIGKVTSVHDCCLQCMSLLYTIAVYNL